MPSGTIRYWASARSAAGVAEEAAVGTTLADLLDGARRRHADRPRLAAVLGVSSYVVDGRPAGRRALDTVELADGFVVEVLPPFAGG